MEVRKRLRFSPHDDLILLREVVNLNPLTKNENWLMIQRKLQNMTGKNFTLRALKDHLQLLLQLFGRKKEENKKRSGIKEVNTERENLLQKIVDICKNNNVYIKKRNILPKEKQIVEFEEEIKQLYARELKEGKIPNTPEGEEIIVQDNFEYIYCKNENILSENPADGPIDDTQTNSIIDEIKCNQNTCDPLDDTQINSKDDEIKYEQQVIDATSEDIQTDPIQHNNTIRPIKRKWCAVPRQTNALDYIRSKEVSERQIKWKELELEEKKLKLEERKIALEEKKIEMELKARQESQQLELEKFQLECTERTKIHNLLEMQQQIIDKLMNNM